MSDESFVDTNIIAYSFDKSNRSKREACRKLVKGCFEGETHGYVSNQILSELFVVLTSKVGRRLSKEKAGTVVRGFIDSKMWTMANYDHATVKRAVLDSRLIDAPFWDLLIAETMREASVKRIYTENVKDFKDIPWVEAVSPL